MFWYYLLSLFLVFFIQQSVLVYKQFQAPPCEQSEHSKGSSCYWPLFRPAPAKAGLWTFDWAKERNRSVHDANSLGSSADNSGLGGDVVDFHIFLTDEPNMKWYLKEGFETSKHWFSKSRVPFGESFEAEKIPVPLRAYFPGVRLNISGPLEAHVFMVRRFPEDDAAINDTSEQVDAGTNANGTVNSTALLEDANTIPSYNRLLQFFMSQEEASALGPPVGGMLSGDIVHTSGPLTSLLPKSRRKVRRNLLIGRMHKVARNAGTSGNSSGSGVNGSGVNSTHNTSDLQHSDEAESTDLTPQDLAEAEFERQLEGKYVQQKYRPLPLAGPSVTIPGLMYKVTVTDDIRAIDLRFFGSSDQGVPDGLEGDYVSGGGFDVAIYPDESLMWLGTFFVGTSFLAPSLPLSALRFFAGPFTLLPLYYMKTLVLEEETRQIRLREKDRQQHIRDLIHEEADSEEDDGTSTDSSGNRSAKLPHLRDVLSGKKTPPVPHLIPTLNLQLPLDGNEYASVMLQKNKQGRMKAQKIPPPLVSFKVNLDQKGTGGMEPEFIRYQVLSGNKLGKTEAKIGNGDGAAHNQDHMYYGPMLNVDQMSVMQRFYRALEDDEQMPDPRVTIRLETIPMWRYSVNSMMRNAMKTFEENSGMTRRDLEDVQELLFRHPIHLLIAMQVVAWLSFFFSAMAFKNEVGYFKGREDYRGLSSRSFLTETIHSVVILLYMWDFDDTSNMVMLQMGIGTFIDLWKYGRVARLGIYIEHKLPWVLSMRDTSSEFVKQKISQVRAAVLAPPGFERSIKTNMLTLVGSEPAANGDPPSTTEDASVDETSESIGGQMAKEAEATATPTECDEPQREGLRRRDVGAASDGELEGLPQAGEAKALGSQADPAETGGETSTVAMVQERDRIMQQKQHAKAEGITEDIDKKGMFYLACVLYPLAVYWAGYNLYTYKYKSFWSWLISSMADFAYSFGFINMMPQIFINYKLKTVAFMPWRVLMYKFFKTFIDDVVAFFILHEHMSEKHRWMTLRDDFVFLIFMYQWLIYGADRNRADEFGYVYQQAEQPANSSANAGDSADAAVDLKKSS